MSEIDSITPPLTERLGDKDIKLARDHKWEELATEIQGRMSAYGETEGPVTNSLTWLFENLWKIEGASAVGIAFDSRGLNFPMLHIHIFSTLDSIFSEGMFDSARAQMRFVTQEARTQAFQEGKVDFDFRFFGPEKPERKTKKVQFTPAFEDFQRHLLLDEQLLHIPIISMFPLNPVAAQQFVQEV